MRFDRARQGCTGVERRCRRGGVADRPLAAEVNIMIRRIVEFKELGLVKSAAVAAIDVQLAEYNVARIHDGLLHIADRRRSAGKLVHFFGDKIDLLLAARIVERKRE
ncbi:hypothetical protein D3C75_826950 [compost metagenome]